MSDAGVNHEAREEELVEQSLLETVGDLREAGEIPEHSDEVEHVLARHPHPVGRTEEEAVLGGHPPHVGGQDFGGRAEQSVTVQRRPGRDAGTRGIGQGRRRNIADEVCRLERRLAGGKPVDPEGEPRRGLRRGHVALNEEGPGDAPPDQRLGIHFHLRHGERRGRVTQPSECLVARKQHPTGGAAPVFTLGGNPHSNEHALES